MNGELVRKLRLTDGAKAVVLFPPAGYDVLGELGLPAIAGLSTDADVKLDSASYDYVHLFVSSMAELAERAPAAIGAVRWDGLLWISYPKGSSGIKTDVNRDSGWQFMKALDMDAVSNISMNETWSALRFRPAGAGDSGKTRAKREREQESAGNRSEVIRVADAALPEMPADLTKALQASPAAADFFATLTDSMKRDYLRWILDAKREDTRTKRVAATIEKLEQGRKRPTDK
ncbi:YdeI/OmpD-associated family protein [Paenibacillus sp. PAMC21692]|uniref:YdeI/OmpD-associated family protein n=1 Tax=Paenibacillus sp. PAMC21692 TaxID=2762320 RepID=UPI00164E910E|nr:YdeI/OmpD-associated family protein [Paenibacillus sp. PAMC21692]QNK60075.1 YdeI/OmpD-associated family protein [Paenibacillus sp. PAMC21692]